MHLLAAERHEVGDGNAAVDLGQSPGDIVVLSAADTEIACLAAARRRLAEGPSVRLASLLRLSHHLSVDLYTDRVIASARLVIVRLLGGRGYWPHGVDRLVGICRQAGIPLALLPGDATPDPELADLGSVPAAVRDRLWNYLVQGGVDNAEQFLRFAGGLIGWDLPWREPAPLLPAGLYRPGIDLPSLDDLRSGWKAGAPVAAVIFYRALVQAANLAPVDALVAALAERGLNPLPVFVQSLKDAASAGLLDRVLGSARPDIVLNATGFAVGSPGQAHRPGVLERCDCPVLQVVFSGGGEAAWRDGTRGLDARDIAMNVALPEIDGRVLSRAVSFKGGLVRDPLTEADLVEYRPVPDRIAFTADLAAAWVRLRRKPAAERRLALILANYPNRDGRIGNGVGLDTPAAIMVVLDALRSTGYRIGDIPADGGALIRRLTAGPTNDLAASRGRELDESLPLIDYMAFFASLPREIRDAVTRRWGSPEADPAFRPGRLDCGRFAISAFRLGAVVIGLQPARGYHIDPAGSYHDPDLVPPHSYLAFHAWLRDDFRADAVIHMGKHGNLEWLPGKALALSQTCFPEAMLGPTPHFYPFIVNDPGEGTQAKRRTAAVIIDHLTPPLTRADTYGPLAELERLVDEYYEASQIDPRRLALLGRQILDLAADRGLDRDSGAAGEAGEAALRKLDAYLCDLKEMQIRDGLHVFGRSPVGRQRIDLAVALARVPRGGRPAEASLIRALAGDLDLGFDPLDADFAAVWTGPRPAVLVSGAESAGSGLRPSPSGRGQGEGGSAGWKSSNRLGTPSPYPLPEGEGSNWRSTGDTVERLEALAHALVGGACACDPAWTRSAAVLAEIHERILPAIDQCGAAEIDGLLRGLDGRFVAPGPSGAPSRGRPEVLPTGRNFYSLDTRGVPTPAAWQLGWKSAQMLVARHAQEHGDYPRALVLSAWGTSCMRTGGDDIAQGLALMGVRPVWDQARVAGFEIMPAGLLDRPRVDVTLRVSGFFRDAFPGLIDLFDSAARAVALLDEPAEVNPLADRVGREAEALVADGLSAGEARRRAGFRVFGSKPGAYGAGLQALIDEGGWSGDADFAEAYLAWGGYAYGDGAEGAPARDILAERLQRVEAVVQNQDNREHDLLDSDDYYQFEGGLAVTVRHLTGRAPASWHIDHSRPETPRIRTLEEEIGRVVHGRAVNPKWIAGVMRHGYKGGFEMAATVDYLFAFSATTGAVASHHFDAVYEAYLGDAEVRNFLSDHNPAALAEMAGRFEEAIRRGLWRPKSNSAADRLSELGNRRPA